MSDLPLPAPIVPQSLKGRLNRLFASRKFQSWAARFPLTRGVTRREGEAIFDVVAGFVHSQCLLALVEFRVLEQLLDAPKSVAQLSHTAAIPEDRMRVLVQAGGALGLLRISRNIHLTRRGAALVGVPGLGDMIRHHAVLYRDLSDPVQFFRGDRKTELAQFWPYVFGADSADQPDEAARYSRLMTESQALVAEDTLAAVSFKGVRHLMDVGGGTGAFLRAAIAATPGLTGTLFDLPAVVEGAQVSERMSVTPGSFRDDPLPKTADAISLVRVLYDHQDDTVISLLKKAFSALPAGGRIIISEPMLGCRAGDAYFAIYTLAMQTGTTRSAQEVTALLKQAGFAGIHCPRPIRPFVTSVVEGHKPH